MAVHQLLLHQPAYVPFAHPLQGVGQALRHFRRDAARVGQLQEVHVNHLRFEIALGSRVAAVEGLEQADDGGVQNCQK